MTLPDFVIRFIGRRVANKLKLGENMDGSKPWYKSATIWSDVCTVLISIVALVDKDFGTHITVNHYYQIAMTLLGAMGLYGRATADTTLTK